MHDIENEIEINWPPEKRLELKEAFTNKKKFYKINTFSIKDIYLYLSSFGDVEKMENKIKDEEVFHTQIYAIISTSYLKNHALLVDNKFMIGIPYFHLKISDNLFTLIEILKSINMLKEEFVQFLKEEKLKKNQNSNIPNRESHKPYFKSPSNMHFDKNTPKASGSKSRISKEDIILLEELNFLLRDHLKEGDAKKNCKHCIIKFKKSSVIFNLIFGDFSDYFKDFHKTDFFLLEKLIKKQMDKNSNYGIYIDFFSCQRLKSQIYNDLHPEDNESKEYVVSLNWPFLLVTVDTGFFKNNMTIHCSRAVTSKKKRRKTTEEDHKSQGNYDSNLSSPEKSRFAQYALLKEEEGFSSKIYNNKPMEEDVINI